MATEKGSFFTTKIPSHKLSFHVHIMAEYFVPESKERKEMRKMGRGTKAESEIDRKMGERDKHRDREALERERDRGRESETETCALTSKWGFSGFFFFFWPSHVENSHPSVITYQVLLNHTKS